MEGFLVGRRAEGLRVEAVCMKRCVGTGRMIAVHLMGVVILFTLSGLLSERILAQVPPGSSSQGPSSNGEPQVTSAVASSSAANESSASVAPGALPNGGGSLPEAEQALGIPSPSYDPSGRRDPFSALVNLGRGDGKERRDLPPLQRIGLTELNIIGVIWGGFGYTAMVQTPDGKGYAVRRGTRVGPNNGVVTSITEKGIVVTERFTDIYGKQQEREHVKLLHIDEESE